MYNNWKAGLSISRPKCVAFKYEHSCVRLTFILFWTFVWKQWNEFYEVFSFSLSQYALLLTALTLHTYHITENKNPCQWITSQEHACADTDSIKRWVCTLHSARYTCIERRLHQEARNSCLGCQNMVRFVSKLNDGTGSQTFNGTYILPAT